MQNSGDIAKITSLSKPMNDLNTCQTTSDASCSMEQVKSSPAIQPMKNKVVKNVVVPNSVGSTPKRQFLSVRKLSDDELSEADSMAR